MSVLGNGSAQFKFAEVLPVEKDHAVFNVTDYASNQIGGKKRSSKKSRSSKRRQRGGNISAPLDFTPFQVDNSSGDVGAGNSTVGLALSATEIPSVVEQNPDVISGTGEGAGADATAVVTPSATNPAISVGGRRRSKKRSSKRRSSKKRGGAKKRSSKKRSAKRRR